MPVTVYRHRMDPQRPLQDASAGVGSATSVAYPLLTGIALGFSFPPSPLPMLAWGALVPLLLRWTDVQSGARMLGEAYGAFSVACAIAFYWVLLHDIPEAALASLGGLLLIPLLMALPFVASLPLRQYWGIGAGFSALCTFYLSMEWVLSHGPIALPWPVLGHTQATLDPFRQIADLVGVPGLTAWVLALNVCIAALIRSQRPSTRGTLALTCVVLLGGAAGYGTERLQTAPPRSTTTQAVIVQPSMPPDSWSEVASTARVDTLLALSTAALDSATTPTQLVVWPETALPALTDPLEQEALYARLQQWTVEHETTLLAGGIEPAYAQSQRPVYFNMALLIRPDSYQRYRKNRLVPFAEQVPFSASLPRLQMLSVPAGGVAGYRRGIHQPTLHGPSFHAGALICFESTFSHHVRRYVDANWSTPPVDFLVTLAQNGWWGNSPGYRQHLAFSQLRAIEVRRAMAFVTVSGVSALIDQRGHSVTRTDWMERTARHIAIPHSTAQTFYVRYGYWLSPAALLLALGFALAGLMRVVIRRVFQGRPTHPMHP